MKKFFERFENWKIVSLFRKAVRLALHDLFRELELTKLTSEMVLAELRKEPLGRVSGLADEVRFWDQRIGSILASPGGFEWYFDPKSQLTGFYLDTFQDLVKTFPPEKIKVLDVGAGPSTNIGKCWNDIRLNITAVDPLAPYYDEILRKYSVDPPVRTVFGVAEHLASQFPPESFEWANAANSLDHVASPIDALRELFPLIKPQGCITLCNIPNEAEREGYSGFHQWNFYQEGQAFYISGRNRSQAVNVNDILPKNFSIDVVTKSMLYVTIKRYE